MGPEHKSWLSKHKYEVTPVVAIAAATLIALAVFNFSGSITVKDAFGEGPQTQETVDWSVVHDRVETLYGTDAGDTISDAVDIMVIDAFLTLRDSTLEALKNAGTISTWEALDAIPGFGKKRNFKVYCLGYDLG